MKNRDVQSSLFCIGVGVIFLIGSWQQGLIRESVPGPGFFPFIIAIVLISLSLMIFIPAFRYRKNGREIQEENFFPEQDSRKKISLALIALFSYGFLLKYTGFLLTTFLFIFLIPNLIERQRPRTLFIWALLTTILSYLIFVALEVRLPMGILKI
jgi:hypothetical protein